jgi:hypothetical protein
MYAADALRNIPFQICHSIWLFSPGNTKTQLLINVALFTWKYKNSITHQCGSFHLEIQKLNYSSMWLFSPENTKTHLLINVALFTWKYKNSITHPYGFFHLEIQKLNYSSMWLFSPGNTKTQLLINVAFSPGNTKTQLLIKKAFSTKNPNKNFYSSMWKSIQKLSNSFQYFVNIECQ